MRNKKCRYPSETCLFLMKTTSLKNIRLTERVYISNHAVFLPDQVDAPSSSSSTHTQLLQGVRQTINLKKKDNLLAELKAEVLRQCCLLKRWLSLLCMRT